MILKENVLSKGKQAQVSLTSELLILDVSQIPRYEHKLFTGRGQYPKFKFKPITRKNADTHKSMSDLIYWGTVKQLFRHAIQIIKNANPDQIRTIVLPLCKVLGSVELHSQELSDELADEASILSKMLQSCFDLAALCFTLGKVAGTVDAIHKYIYIYITSIPVFWIRNGSSLSGINCPCMGGPSLNGFPN